MSPPDEQLPPRELGDYPDGAYWTADRPAASVDPDALDYSVTGDVLKFMWDYGVVVPLWDGGGLLPEEPEWLRTTLGLSDALIRDLMDWGSEMNHLDAHPPLRTDEAYRDLDRRARALVDRLRQDVGSRFRVEYKPW